MTIRTHADHAQVHWLVNDATEGVLKDTHALLYVPKSPTKLGQVTRDSAAGLTPQAAFVERYGDKSQASQDIEAVDLFVVPKVHGADFDYDDGVRKLIHHLHVTKKFQFDALYPGHQILNTNSEALLGYDRNQHLAVLIKTIKQYFSLGEYFDTRNSLTWRWKQQEDIDLILECLDKHKLCLFAAYTSRGKTKISMEVAHQLLPGGGIVLVTTPITDTKKSFEENCTQYHFGNTRAQKTTYMDSKAFAQVDMQDLEDRAESGELIFVVLTVQDLRWGESLDTDADPQTVQLREKYADLSGHVDLWIRDERHSQYNGFVTSNRLAHMKARWELDLTATPYNCYDKYESHHVVSRTLLWGLQNRENTKLPKIRIDAIGAAGMAVIPELSAIYTAQEGYDPRKLFLRDNQQFVMEQEIVKIADGFYQNSRSKHKNPISISNDTLLSGAAKCCGMWVLPQGQAGDSVGDYLPALAEVLNRRSGKGIFYMDSYTVEKACPKNVTIGDFVQSLIKTHARVIILTCGKFLTGTDIPSLGHVVLFDRMESVANFEQLMGRMIREYPHKDEVKLYVMAPGTTVGVVLGRMAKINAALEGGSEYAVLDCIPLSEYKGTSFNQLSAEEILTATQEWFRTQVKNKISTSSLKLAVHMENDVTAWENLNLNHLKQVLPRTKLSDDIKAKVRQKISINPHTGNPRSKDEIDQIEQIVNIIQSVVFEAQWVAFSINNSDWKVVLAHDAIEQMFGKEVMQAVVATLQNNPKIEQMVQEHLTTKQQAYRSLPPEEVYPELFGNSKLKQSIGIVYTSFELADELIAAIPN